jgi:hypothetical protein
MDCRETSVTGPLTGSQDGDVEGVLSHPKPKACAASLGFIAPRSCMQGDR